MPCLEQDSLSHTTLTRFEFPGIRLVCSSTDPQRSLPITPQRFMLLDDCSSDICPAIIPSDFTVWRLYIQLSDFFSPKNLVLYSMSITLVIP